MFDLTTAFIYLFLLFVWMGLYYFNDFRLMCVCVCMGGYILYFQLIYDNWNLSRLELQLLSLNDYDGMVDGFTMNNFVQDYTVQYAYLGFVTPCFQVVLI